MTPIQNKHLLKIDPTITPTFFSNLIKEQDQVQKYFKDEINKWGTQKIKLIILGEAPLSSDKYFYHPKNKPGNFLSGLRAHYSLSGTGKLIDTLRLKGILVVDLYQFSIPTTFYDKDKGNVLYDDDHFGILLNQISPLLDANTKYVFRYKKLIKRDLQKSFTNLKKLNFILDSAGNPLHLFTKERPMQILDPSVIPFL